MATFANAYPGSAFSPLPFDKHDDIRSVVLKDTFIQLVADADVVGANTFSDLTWVGNEVGVTTGPASVAVKDGEPNHPGIAQLEVNATAATVEAGDGLALSPCDDRDAFELDDNDLYVAAVIRIPSASSQTLAQTIVRFGLSDTNGSDEDQIGLNGFEFVYDPTDADNTDDKYFFAQSAVAGTNQEVLLTDVVVAQDEWILLEISATDAGAYFRITTEDAQQVAYISAAVTVGLAPFIMVRAVAANVLTNLEVDTFLLRYLVQKTPSAGTYGTVGGLDRLLLTTT